MGMWLRPAIQIDFHSYRPIPTDPDGKYIWIEIDSIEIEEIDNYHGK